MRNVPSRVVLAPMNLPMRMPWLHTLVLWLALDYFHAPGWAWGAVGLFLLFAWICWVRDLATRKDLTLEDLLPPTKQRK